MHGVRAAAGGCRPSMKRGQGYGIMKKEEQSFVAREGFWLFLVYADKKKTPDFRKQHVSFE